MTRYIRKTEANPGPFQVRLEANPYVKGDVAKLVDITDDPQPFDDGRAQQLLNSYPKLVEEVAVGDVGDAFLSADDFRVRELEVVEPVRFGCEVEDCDKDYATEKNLERHSKSVHGSFLEKLLTPSS